MPFKQLFRKSIYFILLWLATAPAYAAHLSPGVEIEVKKEQEIVTFRFKDEVQPKVFSLPVPPRLVVDVPTLKDRSAYSLPKNSGAKLIKAMRIGQFDAETSRIVLDLAEEADFSQHPEKKDGGVILTLNLTADETHASSEKPKDKKPKYVRKRPDKPLIVIDAGHGGQDPGAMGANNTQEKDVVLSYARALKQALLATKRYDVYLTRDEDKFILLRERIALAKKAGGTLFISLHADSAPEQLEARGLSVYTLSETASDKETEALAAQENKVDVLSGLDISNESEDVANILISLAQRETRNKSALLADSLVNELLQNDIRLLPNTHRFAGFAVLKSPDIPSVLVEIGFLSNKAEEKLINTRAHREKLAKALVSGIDAYITLERRQDERADRGDQ